MESNYGIPDTTSKELVDFIYNIKTPDRKPGQVVRFMMIPDTVQFLGKMYHINNVLEVTDTTMYDDGSDQWSHARVVFQLDQQTGKIHAKVVNFPWSVASEIISFLDRKSKSSEWPIADVLYVPKH